MPQRHEEFQQVYVIFKNICDVYIFTQVTRAFHIPW